MAVNNGSNITYESGVWTPTLVGSSAAGSTTYVSQTGYYTRVGNLVWIMGRVQISAATGTGDALFGGLPFTIKNQTNGHAWGSIAIDAAGWTWSTGYTDIVLFGILNTTTCSISQSGSAKGRLNMPITNAAAIFNFSMVYQVA